MSKEISYTLNSVVIGRHMLLKLWIVVIFNMSKRVPSTIDIRYEEAYAVTV